MNFYKNIFYFIIILQLPSVQLHNKELRINKSGVADPSACKIGLEFFTELNNTSSEDFHVELMPDECCLTDESEDCDSLQIIGECSEVIPRDTTKVLTLVAPLIDPFERKGYCTIHVDSRPIDSKRSIMRDTLNIQFDTRIKDKDNIEEDLAHCKNKDEDPLNGCKPVNCETYYNGKKSHFDKHTKRCTEVPPCIDRKRNKSKQVYDSKNNRCVDEVSINDEDIEFIKSLSKKERRPKDILIIKSVYNPDTKFIHKPLPETSIENFSKFDTANDTKATALKVQSKILCQTAIQYFTQNRYTLIGLGLVITVQCFLIVTMVYCLSSNSSCCNKKKVVRKFFNYRQDASVTTPLIGTSNMDTETTEFDFVSESSNIDKKIKCYKACQKERQNDAKMSMSDDILSKCLNRRDWSSKPKSDTIQEATNFEAKRSYNDESKQIKENDENEVTCIKYEEKPKENEENNKDKESNSAISEKEIRFHNYNVKSKVDFKALDNVSLDKSHKKATSMSTEKGAQACFSNDSIDDFLSERGLLFLGENASKYSFTSTSSPDKSSLTELTSKTSKNNVIRNVISFLSKSKLGTSSDPGMKKTKSKNLELIHISHASVYSSSSDINNIKSEKPVKDYRNTF